MRTKLVVLIAVAAVLLLPAAAQAAPKHEDFRPWKAAMFAWFDDYRYNRWSQGVDLSDYDGPWITIETPEGFYGWTNRWGEHARLFAQFITAVEGQMPNGQFDRPLKTILTPYLGIKVDISPGAQMAGRLLR